eukprot:403336438
MLNKFIANKFLFSGSQRAFASLNTSSLEAALKDPTHLNWNQFFSSTNPKDVAESDPRTVGKLLRVLSHTDDSQQTQAISNAVDEYFRKRFRTLDQEVALEILKDLGSQDSARIPALDSKFWVWETLETAVSQSVMNLNEEDLWKVTKAFYGNAKGSENFQRDFETRYAQLTATF